MANANGVVQPVKAANLKAARQHGQTNKRILRLKASLSVSATIATNRPHANQHQLATTTIQSTQHVARWLRLSLHIVILLRMVQRNGGATTIVSDAGRGASSTPKKSRDSG
jgi:hypothetical protein